MATTTTTTCMGWSHLHEDLLCSIFEKLIARRDQDQLSSCARVCVSWRSATYQVIKKNSPIILLRNQGKERVDQFGALLTNFLPNQGQYRLFNTRTRITQEIMLPGKQFSCAWPGWLLTDNGEYPPEINLLNPSTKAHIKLPCPWYKENHTQTDFRVLPCSNPSDPGCILLGTYSSSGDRTIGFCRPRDEAWSTITVKYRGERVHLWDATCYKGDFYMVGCVRYDGYKDHYMYCIHVDKTTMNLTIEKKFVRLPKPSEVMRKYYLVELMDELLLIETYTKTKRKSFTEAAISMKIHKLQVNGHDMRWVGVRWLGVKHAIYLGYLQSMSVYLGECNGRSECRVYLIDKCIEHRARSKNSIFRFDKRHFRKLRGFPWANTMDWFDFSEKDIQCISSSTSFSAP